MTSLESSPEDLHRILVSNEQLGVNMELTLNHPAIEILDPQDKELLEKLLRAEAYTFAMLILVKEDMPTAEWRNGIIHAIDDQHETVFNPEGYLPQRYLAAFTGWDIEKPAYERELHEIPTTESA